jgi:hypothetical protein
MAVRGRSAEERALRRLGHPRDEWPDEVRHLGPVADAVELLPPRQREILVLHYYGDCDVAEIARMLGISPGTVKSALHRARATLASALAPHYRFRRTAVKGWMMAGSHPSDYEFGRIPGSVPVVSIRSTATDPRGFGTMMQTIAADAYRGRRMRVSCELRAIGIDDRVGLWMRVDGDRRDPLAFDNMEDRPISGTTDAERVDVVLDVDPAATAIAFGVLLIGKGEAHISGFRFEEVPATVPLTGRAPHWLSDAPVNLTFTE